MTETANTSQRESPEQPRKAARSAPGRLLYQAAVQTALVAGLFSLTVAVLMVSNHYRSKRVDPRDSKEVADLKLALGKQPNDEAIKTRIRALDLRLRREFLSRQGFAARGTWLLLGGIAVFLASAKLAAACRRKLPMPEARPEEPGVESRAATVARWSVGGLGVALGVAAAFLPTCAGRDWVREAVTPAGGGPSAAALYPSPEEIKKNWPRFRGPGGLGVSAYANEPSSWDGKTGKGILWKAAVPLWAPSSPIVWGDRVFLSGASKQKREVHCFDANTGMLLWQKPVEKVPGTPAEPPDVMETSGLAASTMTTDGQRVYAIFADGDLACFDLAGKRVWARNLGKPENPYGHASSLAMWRNRLLVLFDQGQPEDGKSKLMALDAHSGRTVWETRREAPSTWSTPIVIQTTKREQIVTCGNPWVTAYDPPTGAELWKVKCLAGEIAPSPVYGKGMVFVANAGSKLAAIRPDGQGDVTATHVAWGAEDGLPDICSPLTNGDLVFLLTTEGLLTCYDAKNGEKLWEKEFETSFSSSPSLVGDRVYLTSDKGVTLIVAAAREFKELGKAELGEGVSASPAFLDGRIYMRGRKHLFCIGAK